MKDENGRYHCDQELAAKPNYGVRPCNRNAIVMCVVDGVETHYCVHHKDKAPTWTKAIPKIRSKDFGNYKFQHPHHGWGNTRD